MTLSTFNLPHVPLGLSLINSFPCRTAPRFSSRYSPITQQFSLPKRYHGYHDNPLKVPISYIDRTIGPDQELPTNATRCNDGSVEIIVDIACGNDVMECAHHHGIDIEGACEGSLACSTCHVIVADEDVFEKLGEPSMREEDLLDLAPGVTSTSRLGCQAIITKDVIDWAEKNNKKLEFLLPKSTLNFYVDGFKPEPH
eukprot:GHVH01016443.1.p1 GENE.GHVH01016443.1~~GHVH01016443.1.p1  ORF type:complete len:198 (-),score=11.82 GHVH01016443.1:100-693(-)